MAVSINYLPVHVGIAENGAMIPALALVLIITLIANRHKNGPRLTQKLLFYTVDLNVVFHSKIITVFLDHTSLVNAHGIYSFRIALSGGADLIDESVSYFQHIVNGNLCYSIFMEQNRNFSVVCTAG